LKITRKYKFYPKIHSEFLRTNLLESNSNIVNVDPVIAKSSAEIRHKYKIPMADSIITAYNFFIKCPVSYRQYTSKAIKEVRIQWI